MRSLLRKENNRLHNRNSKNVRPNRNENGFMTFVADYVRFNDFNSRQ